MTRFFYWFTSPIIQLSIDIIFLVAFLAWLYYDLKRHAAGAAAFDGFILGLIIGRWLPSDIQRLREEHDG